ncbi:MAG: hypothetical protein KY476_04550 [Planctomycetes bacterium]|nr:hypothetical protein [Planctomycetota bacterium]
MHLTSRVPAAIFIALWLAFAGWHFLRHAIGDAARGAVGYGWTWDMYPGYAAASSRRVAIARTASGRYLLLAPNDALAFRLHGRRGEHESDGVPLPRGLSRLDLNHRLEFFRDAAESAITRRSAGKELDPVTHISLVEAYWPSRFNLPDDLYLAEHGEPKPHRRYWRVVDEASVSANGQASWLRADNSRGQTPLRANDAEQP